MRIFHYFNAPIRIPVISQPVEGMLQPFDRKDMAPVKSPDGVVFDESDGPDRRHIRPNIETEDTVAHTQYYQYCDAIARDTTAVIVPFK